ncbi:hypothetical protein BVH03_17690 [Pseudomonas sp. PA15(2017)]|uniref:DUF5983 family protein n=1 Tax=Pseudomonas sp. PA15(2017) TaxID=1932111 RepID=UPI000968AA57|nr:hypothetical protein [Pseudomonas sp. PA15(2017)]OLU25487.1 hypothetical protein BVH03_17690 [Pseudomonas sp. PA15(2017)]
MSHFPNPFLRGFYSFTIERQLQIFREADQPTIFRPLHPSQGNLTDEMVNRHPCIYSCDFALVTEGQEITPELEEHFHGSGVACRVTYSLFGHRESTSIFLGDYDNFALAMAISEQLTFRTGHFSRAWEISSLHLPEKALEHAQRLAGFEIPSGQLVEFFLLPGCDGVGCKLFMTPWSDENLAGLGLTAEKLRQEHLDNGLHLNLIELLHQAAAADVRFLVFDPDADRLQDLPIYDLKG